MTFLVREVTLKRQAREVLQNLSYHFEQGLLTAVIGPNGSGKSSLLRALYGYLPTASGAILMEEKELANWDPRSLAGRLGVCPQEVEPSLDFRVEQALALPLGGQLQAMEERVKPLEFLSLPGLFQRNLSELSGGERQRVRLGMALLTEAPWLILDEPVNHLDLATAWSLLDFLQKPRDGGVIVALHDLTTAARCCGRLLVLKEGRKVAEGAPREVLSSDLLADVFGLQAEMDWSTEAPTLRISGIIR